MILSRGLAGSAGGLPRAAARVAVAGLAAVAVFAAPWASGPAAASGSGGQYRASAAPSPAPVKYYIVIPRPRNGPAQSLYEIAVQTLGAGRRYVEIFKLNEGRLQPDGGRLVDPHVIKPGWVLQLPGDASGPSVRFGPLPGAGAPVSAAPVAHRPSPPAAGGTAAHRGLSGPVMAGGMLAVAAIAVLGLTAGLRSRARRRARRRAARGGAGRPRLSDSGEFPLVTGADPGPAGPLWVGGEHPGWPGAGDPRWAGGEHPSWPGGGDPNWPRAIGGTAGKPGNPGPAMHHDQRRHAVASPVPAAPPAPVRVPGGTSGPPAGVSGGARQWPAQPASNAGPATRAHYDVATGGVRIQVLAGPPAMGRGDPPGAIPRTGQMRTFHGHPGATLVSPGPPDPKGLLNADAVRLAARILAEADGKAAATLTAAEQEAAKIMRQASEQAAATLTAAQREATDLRTTVQQMSAELGGVAAYVIANLASPAQAVAPPAPRAVADVISPARPSAEPAPPATEPARPTARPARPTAEPAQPPARPAAPVTTPGMPRQYQAMRLARFAVTALLLVAVVAGSTEIALHGFRFFVFRSAGTGATPDTGLQENQGPGQPDAPGVQHKLSR